MRHYAATRVERPRRRIDAQGRLVLAEPYRWNPALQGVPTPVLGQRLWGEPYGSYAHATIQDEIDRRKPATASLCYDVSKGWEPL